MKNANVRDKKIIQAAQPRRVAGVPVRSGIKAGRRGFGEDVDPRQRMTSPLDNAHRLG